jgi:phosphate transport system substrate-binding protein
MAQFQSRYIAFALAAALLTACGGGTTQPVTANNGGGNDGSQAQQINGAGATFPNPIYSKWFAEYNKLHPNIRINYQSIGSGGGIQQLTNQTVFFGATDGPMNDEQLKAAPGPILHFPTVLGAVVPVYNIPGITDDLKFTARFSPISISARSRSGTIRRSPSSIRARSCRRRTSPSCIAPMVPARPTSSWTTSRRCPRVQVTGRREHVGEVARGCRRQGQRGRLGPRHADAGSIGYVELVYALQNKIAFGSVQNATGEFVKASVDAVTKAADSAAATIPPDFRVSITNASGAGRVPDLVLHVDPAVRGSEGQGRRQGDGRLHALGAHRRPEVLRATSATRRCRPTSSCSNRPRSQKIKARRRAVRSPTLGFRLGIGVFAAALLLVVVAIGVTLANDSWLSLQRFGWTSGARATGTRSRATSARCPFIWGTLYSSCWRC